MKTYVPSRALSVKGKIRVVAAAAGCLGIFILFRRAVVNAAIVVSGAAFIAFLVCPLARVFEQRFERKAAALCALLSVLFAFVAAMALLLPLLVIDFIDLVHTLPASVQKVSELLKQVSAWLTRILPGIRLPSFSVAGNRLPEIARETMIFISGIADGVYRFSLMVILSYFFLCDREKLLIRLELLIPTRARCAAVTMCEAVCRELKNYLRGQGLISVIVGVLSGIGLMMVGVRSALVLGVIVGMLNMIPYFGPVIGAIPAILMAMGDGWHTAVYAALVLWLVQQIDSTLISPRIMSSISGISPAAVLLAVFVGSGLGGIVGMLLAMPVVMAFRTVFRVFVQRYENV